MECLPAAAAPESVQQTLRGAPAGSAQRPGLMGCGASAASRPLAAADETPQSKTPGLNSGVRIVKREELVAHNNADSIWLAVYGKVYDLTDFLPDHPGSPATMLSHAGQEVDSEFAMFHDDEVLLRPKIKLVGFLEGSNAAKQAIS